MSNIIKLLNLNKTFDNSKKIKVLKKISFNFKKGKIYSLMGPSGSGKSTLLNLLSLIDRPSSGSITIENKVINFNEKNRNDILRARNIGIIYQQDNLLPDFTAMENIYLASLAAGYNKDTSISKAKNLLKKVKLLNRSNHFPSELSGGEQQRVAIARALIAETNLILADEPTGNLDYKTSKEIFSLFLKLKKLKKTIIFATHNRELANRADYKLFISNGDIKRVNAR